MKAEYVIQKAKPHEIVALDKNSGSTIHFQPNFLKRWYERGWIEIANPDTLYPFI